MFYVTSMLNLGEHQSGFISIAHLLFLCSKLQSFLLQQQTFLEKCETWMEFLVQTEENLAVEISGNYQSLMEQQKAHEVRESFFLIKRPWNSYLINYESPFINNGIDVFQLFQAEMFSRQQILHSIISDGQRMLEQGQVDDR